MVEYNVHILTIRWLFTANNQTYTLNFWCKKSKNFDDARQAEPKIVDQFCIISPKPKPTNSVH